MNALTLNIFPSILSLLALSWGAEVQAAVLKAPPYALVANRAEKSVEIVATAPSQHHFNTEAPASLVSGKDKLKPSPFDKQKATFKLDGVAARDLTVSLFVCDDANTFCEKHVVKAKWDGATLKLNLGGVISKSMSASVTTPANATASSSGGADAHGFFVNEPQKALELARERNQPMMIDFYGIWCPPCNEYDAKVFSAPEFAKDSSGFVKLKLDVDQRVSWELKSKYRVGGYPTILFTTPEGDEITRIVGYRAKDLFLPALREAYAQRGMTTAKLQAKADAGDVAAAERLGTIHLEHERFADAQKYLEKATSVRGKQRFWEAKVGALKAAGGSEYLSALQSALKAYPDSAVSISFLQKLAAADSRRANAHHDQTIKVAKQLIASPKKLRNEDWTVADLWAVVADAQAELGQEAESKASWLQSARAFEKRSVGPKDRGNLMEAAWGYWKGGQVAKAEKLYQQLEKNYPTEFTYYYYHSRMFLALNKFKEAREKAEQSFRYAYGDNKLRVAEAYAKALKGEERADEAKKLVAEVLKDLPMPEDATVRTHRYAKALRDLEKTL